MRSLRAPVFVSLVLLLAGVASLASVVLGDGVQLRLGTLPLFGSAATIGVTVNAVSAVLLTFIAGLAFITAEYSRRNLRGQAGLARFARWHITAALSLSLLVTGASLPLLALGWTVSGLAIAALVAHRSSPAAHRAARYVRCRLLVADALLWLGVVAAAVVLPSLDRSSLGPSVAAAAAPAISAVALLLAAAAVVRSSLLPAQRWLFETAEAPSPVSALLHAGVVNAVGLLGVLLWPILAASAAARGLLIVVGAATAAAMTLAMAYRGDVKGKLAASTSAQMGYLAIGVGIGLPLAGMLHLIGHGCYKAHLFLRAGGEVTRARFSLASPRRVRPVAWLAAGVLAIAGTAVGLLTWSKVPLADLLPITVATAAGAVALAAAFEPGRSLRSLTGRGAVVFSGGVIVALLAAYIVVLGWWSSAFPGFAGTAQVWSAPAIAGWFSLLLGTLAATLLVLRALAAGRLPGLRAWLGAASLRPGSRVPAQFLAAEPAAPAPVEDTMVGVAVDAASAVVGPAWPLRHAVAANPLAGLQDLHVRQAGAIAAQTWGARTLPDRAAYRAAFASGRITEADLHAAAGHARGLSGEHDIDLMMKALLGTTSADPLLRSVVAAQLRYVPVERLEQLNASARRAAAHRSLTEQWDARTGGVARLTEVADHHANTWLLDLLAAQREPYGEGELWQAWRSRVAAPGMDRLIGVPGFAAAVAVLPQVPQAALASLLQDVPAQEHIAYLGRLLARNPGWSAHLAWRDYVGDADLRTDLLAIRAAYDVLLVRAALPVVATGGMPVRATHTVVSATADLLAAHGFDADQAELMDVAEIEGAAAVAAAMAGPAGDEVWQTAFEQRYRNRVVDRIEARAAAGPDGTVPPAVHLAMCIDVRSERFRRHLEADPAVATYGFAGFFGLAVRHRPSAGAAADLCPVLLRPNLELSEQLPVLAGGQASARLLGAAAGAAAAAPAVPFAVAEAAAPVSGTLVLAQTVAPRTWRALRDRVRAQGLRGHLEVDAAMTPQQQVDAAYGFLHSVGLSRLDGSLLVVAGHGAALENNAYAAAYDCGACGGNAGYVNARLMAELLNRGEVRAGLADRGVEVAPGLVALPALHITTTDELQIADADVPEAARGAVAELRESLAAAQAASATERVATLPAGRVGDALSDVRRRAADWAEATPEWGLAGNALFVAGPRWMTRGLNLHGRSFLHSYDPAVDTDRSVLETILTAPMVVAQWINSQYYASTVDPIRFGAGDKTTHNVVGDLAVLSGAHGDLRVGLPWQSLFDADPVAREPHIAHEPMRLQVLVYAPGADVLAILQEHPQVLRLVTGEWLSLAVIEPSDASVHRLTTSLRWEAWDTDPAVGVFAGDARGPVHRDRVDNGGTMPA